MAMIRRPAPTLATAALFACAAVPLAAQDRSEPRPAAGTEVFASTDSEGTQVLRTALDFDLRNAGDDRRLGVRYEHAWYDPGDTGTRERDRVFLRAADVAGAWRWQALVGTDGETVIGAVSIHDEASWRKEFFVERDVLETPIGIDRGLYATFAGAAIDVPLGTRDTATVLAGVQEFTGRNVRLHARGNLVHLVNEDLGLTVQLRGRYFRNSVPRELDYYSPRWYAQALPVVQMRRFVDGWELVGVAGIGVQRDATSDWRHADFGQLRARSPRNARNWSFEADLTYTNSPSDNATQGGGYRYLQTRIGFHHRF